MKNQRKKYRNKDGTKRKTLQETHQETHGNTGKFNIPMIGAGSPKSKAKGNKTVRRRMQKASRRAS